MTAKKTGLGWFAKTLIGVAVIGGGTYVGVRIWAAVPPAPLTPEEQAKLRATGVVWASPDAPSPAGVEHMLVFCKSTADANAIDDAEVTALGPIRLVKLTAAGWRFWRPKTPLDTAKESAAKTTPKAGA